MRQSITTYFIAPTNIKGARIKARAGAGTSVTLPWDHALDIHDNHRTAAIALADKNGWAGDFVAGGMADGSRVFVNVSDDGDGFTA